MISFRRVGRYANVAWIVLIDNRETGLSITAGSAEMVTKKAGTTSFDFADFRINDFRDGAKGNILMKGISTIDEAKKAAEKMIRR